jgi:hypothetical protein
MSHSIARSQGKGQFRMGEKDHLNISHASNSGQAAIAGFAAPWFRGSVTYSGNNKQTLVNGTYQNLTITGSGERNVQGHVNLRGILRMESGTLETGDSLTLKSDSLGTALISGNGNGQIKGNVEMERYVHGSGKQVVLFGTAFQNAVLRDYDDDIPVLGPDGVKLSASTEPTVWEYRSDLQDGDFMAAWYSKTKLQEQMLAGKGLMGKVAGGSVIRVRGQVNTGKQRVALKTGNNANTQQGFNLLSNPYPSPVDWNLLIQQAQANVSRSMSKLGSGNRFNGQFATWLPLGNEDGLGVNGATRYIGSQEGFFVKAFRNDTFEFTNQSRVEVLNTRSVTVPEIIPYVRLSLNRDGRADETVVYFSMTNSNFEAIDGKDAMKMIPQAGLSYWFSIKDSVNLAIQGRRSIENRDSVPLGIFAESSGTYQLRLAEAQHFPATAMVMLEDKKTGLFTNLRKQSSLDVQLEAGPNQNRFFLHFKPGVRVSPFREGCEGGNGRIALNNPSESKWDITVFNSNDSLIAQKNAFTGTWQLEQLPADEYRIHFKLTGQNMEVDEWVQVHPGNAIQASMISSVAETTPGETITFTSTTQGSEALFWNFGDGMMASGDPQHEHQYQEPGLYDVILTATKGECSDTAMIRIRVSTVAGLGDELTEDPTTFLVYPNPASILANLRLKNEKPLQDAGLFVIDANGRVAMEKNYPRIDPGQVIELPVDRLARGNYEVVVNAGTFRSVSRLVVAGK